MTDFLRKFDWENFDWRTSTQDIVNRLEEVPAKFFLAYTKAELYEGALKRRVILYPVSTAKDIMESPQLAARKFWFDLEHPELGTSITYPGSWIKSSEITPQIRCRAPLIGEHNQEILGEESGISRENPPMLEQYKGYLTPPNNKSKQDNMERKLLEGVRIIDFRWYAAAPIATKTLCYYGAEVIRIEGRMPVFMLYSFKEVFFPFVV